MLRRKLGTNERRKEQRGSKREWKAGRKEKWSVRGKGKKEESEIECERKGKKENEKEKGRNEGLTCVHPCQFVWRERFFFLWKTYTLHQQGRSRGRFLQHKVR